MRKRSVEILLTLLQKGGEDVTIAHFTQTYQVSERTLRNDLQVINEYLRESGMGQIAVCTNGLLQLPEDIDKAVVFKRLTETDAYAYHMQQKERDDIILAKLLTCEGCITTEEFAEILSVSRPTVVKDINRLRSTHFTGELKLLSMPGVGLKLQYDEALFRRELLRIVEDHFTVISHSLGAFQNILLKTFEFEITLESVAKYTRRGERHAQLQFADKDYVHLVCYLYVAFNRISKGYVLKDTDQSQPDHPVTMIMREVAQNLHVSLPLAEEQFLLQEANGWSITPAVGEGKNQIALKNYVGEFLTSISNDLGINLFSDFYLHCPLSDYLEEEMAHPQNRNAVNPKLTEQICQEYPRVCAAIRSHAGIFEKGLGLHLQEDDVCQLAMYVVASMERQNPFASTPQVLIVCPGSMATGQFLVSQLRKHFAFQIKGVCSVRNLFDEGRLDGVDLIISTIPTWHEQIPVLVVNPLLKLNDIIRIQENVFQLMLKKRRTPMEKRRPKDALAQLQALLDRETDPLRQAVINAEIQKMVDRLTEREASAQAQLPELMQPQQVDVTDVCADWRCALRQAGELLVRAGKVKEAYVESTIRNCEKNGPYFVLGNGLAIAHTHAEDGLIEPAVALLFIRKGVSFGHQAYGPVRLLFFVCLKDANNDLLKLLIDCARDSAFVQKLEKANDGAEIHKLLCGYALSLKTGGIS